LVAATPKPDPSRRRRPKSVPVEPVVAAVPGACPYAPRCTRTQARCRAERPELDTVAPQRQAACFFPMVGRYG
jgi:oligopeptide/dipeptide ABC transporter ATP-binding protein